MVCPLCGRADMIQKASAAYSAGRSRVDLSGGSLGVVLPFSKRKRSSGLAALTSVGGSSQTLLSRRLAPPSKPLPQGFPTGWVFLGILILMGAPALFDVHVVVGIVAALCAVSLFFRAWAGRNRQLIDLAARMKRWEGAFHRWDSLYYCARDDIVFIPGESGHVNPEKMSLFVYQTGRAGDVQG